MCIDVLSVPRWRIISALCFEDLGEVRLVDDEGVENVCL